MGVDLQKASMWKRISAWLFDTILLISIVVLIATGLSAALRYDHYSAQVENVYEKYQTQYNIDFKSIEAPADADPAEKEAYKDRYEKADAALKADEEAVNALGMTNSLMLLIPTLSLFGAMLLMEFLIPLLLKNGQTLGKKVFSIGVVRIDAVKLSPLQLFVRAILSKYTVCLMLPLYITAVGIVGLAVALGMLLLQLICPLVNHDRRGLHDLLSGTVVVDLPSQRVFNSAQDRTEYIKQVHAERAARQDY